MSTTTTPSACKGINCGTTTGEHSPECLAEYQKATTAPLLCPVPHENLVDAHFVIAFTGEGAATYLVQGWNAMLRKFAQETIDYTGKIVDDPDATNRDEWEEWLTMLADPDEWTNDDGGVPHYFSNDVGEITKVSIYRIDFNAGVQAESTVFVDYKQAASLLDMFGGENGEVTLQFGNGHSGLGLYASYTAYPDEGANYLGLCDEEALPEDGDQSSQGAEAIRLLALVRGFIENTCEKPLQLQAVLNVIDLAAKEAEGMAAGEFTQVLKKDASAYCEILSLLGMEEEGDAVAELQDLIAARARYIYLRTHADKTKATGEALDAECDDGITKAVAELARAMYPGAPS